MSSGYGPRVARCPERQGFVVIYAHVTMLELETHCGCARAAPGKQRLPRVHAEGKACPRTVAIKGDSVSVEFG